MTDSNVIDLNKLEQNDPLQEVLREGARKLLAAAIGAEVVAFIAQHRALKTDEHKGAVVRNGYLPERSIQTGLGDIEVKVPKVWDRSGSGIKFNSSLVPPYLSQKRYVYVWADGVYSHVRMDDRLCLLVIIGSDENGRKELVALADGYRESAASWEEVLTDLRQRGLKAAPKLAIGDGALGFWKAVGKLWPETDQQRGWVHKTANVLEKLPKAMQPKVKEALHAIWQAETREAAYQAFDHCLERFEPKYPKAMACLAKDKDAMLAFYDYPAENWQHIRTSNPIESVFATVRLRTTRTKHCGSRTTTLAMAFKLIETAQKKWLRLRGYQRLAEVITGVKFINGIKQTGDQQQDAA